MKASRRWLEAFLRQPLDADDVARRLAMLGAPVDAIEPLHADLGDILVARVEEVVPHPNADRLRVCTVNDGTPDRKTVVCGAPNVTAGRSYPFAPIGAMVPHGKDGTPFRIERAKLRGVASEGMLCSARELGLGQDHAGLWELDTEAVPGTSLEAAMGLRDDCLLLDVTPNRPDLLGHKGIARELSVSYGVPFRLPPLPGGTGVAMPPPRRAADRGELGSVRLAIEDTEGCQRLLAALVFGVTVGPSPRWLRQRLETLGLRSINNVVDATNYVMMELNQPMHAYDVTTLGGGSVLVRRARVGERLQTLDGEERTAPEGALLIADLNAPIALAGIMGGAHTEVSATTRDILLECAWFEPRRIRRTRQALGLSTEASYRFERGVDRWGGPAALRRCIEVILATAGGALVGSPLDLFPEPTHPPRIFLRLARIAQVLGQELPMHLVERYLVGIGATVVAKPEDGRIAVDVPGWRPDLLEEIDLIEEVARLHGYDNFPTDVRPIRIGRLPDAPAWRMAARVRDAMVGLGLLEAQSLPLVPEDGAHAVQVKNPLSQGESFLRRRLVPGLARHVLRNWSERTRDVRLFEIGTVFEAAAPGERPVERQHLGIIVTGASAPAHWTDAAPTDVGLWDAKGLLEAAVAVATPGATIAADGEGWVVRTADGRAVGGAGPVEMDGPPWAGAVFAVELELMEQEPPLAPFRAPPAYPPSERDLALVLGPGQAAEAVEAILRREGAPLLEAVAVLSDYRGQELPAGHRSVAFRLTFRAADRTLRDAEVEDAVSAMVAALARELDVRRRGDA